jgi:hypothetical protein
MYNIENFNTSFNRTLRSLNVNKKTTSYSYRKLHTTYRAYGLEVVITSYYSDSKILYSNFAFAINHNIKDENIHSSSNRTISRYWQLENNRRPIASDTIINRYSDNQLEQFHNVALIASQHLVLTTIESYVNNLFNDVAIELLNHQFELTTGGNN